MSSRFHIYELRMYTDKNCDSRSEVMCDLPFANGRFVDLSRLDEPGVREEYAEGSAFDGDIGRGRIRLEALIELEFLNSSCSSLSSY